MLPDRHPVNTPNYRPSYIASLNVVTATLVVVHEAHRVYVLVCFLAALSTKGALHELVVAPCTEAAAVVIFTVRIPSESLS